jgi:transcriptional regulator with XRE-family HTH domain
MKSPEYNNAIDGFKAREPIHAERIDQTIRDTPLTIDSMGSVTRNWLATAADNPLGITMKYLRLEDPTPVGHYGQDTQSANNTIYVNERSLHTPSLDKMNSIIQASGLDTESYPAQLLRMKCEKRAPLSCTDFANSTTGERIDYVRVAFGFTPEKFSKAIGKSRRELGRWKTGKSTPKETLEVICDSVGISDQDALKLLFTNEPPPLTHELVQNIVKGKLLFAEHVTYARKRKHKQTTIQPKVMTLVNELDRNHVPITIINVIEQIRERNNLSVKDFCRKISISPRQYNVLRLGIASPSDITICKAAEIAGGTIHDITTQWMLYIGEQERREKKK